MDARRRCTPPPPAPRCPPSSPAPARPPSSASSLALLQSCLSGGLLLSVSGLSRTDGEVTSVCIRRTVVGGLATGGWWRSMATGGWRSMALWRRSGGSSGSGAAQSGRLVLGFVQPVPGSQCVSPPPPNPPTNRRPPTPPWGLGKGAGRARKQDAPTLLHGPQCCSASVTGVRSNKHGRCPMPP